MTRRQCLLLALLATLCLPASAAAMPGDAPFGPTSPPDGAAVPVDPDGIPVTYTCPVYRIADTAILLRGRLRHRKISGGRVKLSVGNCTGNASYQAKRSR